MYSNESNQTGHEMLAAVYSGRDILKIKKNIKSAKRKLNRLENELWFVVQDNILWEGATMSDIWSVGYERLLLEAQDNQTIYGFWVLNHFINHWELYSDKRQVKALKEYLDTKFVTPSSYEPLEIDHQNPLQTDVSKCHISLMKS